MVAASTRAKRVECQCSPDNRPCQPLGLRQVLAADGRTRQQARISGRDGGMAAESDGVLDPPDLPLRFALALADLGLFLVLDDLLLDVEPALGDVLEVGELDFLGPLVPVGAVLDLLRPPCRRPSEPASKLVGGLVLGLLGLGLELLVEDAWSGPRARSSVRCLGRFLPQADERLVAGQHVDAVEHERDVVEVEVLDLSPAQLEELLADQVEVGDRDHVDLGWRCGGFFVFLLVSVLLRRRPCLVLRRCRSASAGSWPVIRAASV